MLNSLLWATLKAGMLHRLTGGSSSILGTVLMVITIIAEVFMLVQFDEPEKALQHMLTSQPLFCAAKARGAVSMALCQYPF